MRERMVLHREMSLGPEHWTLVHNILLPWVALRPGMGAKLPIALDQSRPFQHRSSSLNH